MAEFYFTESISGFELFYSAECKSTNAIAKGLIEFYAQTGPFGVYTFNQTQGKGQGNNTWISEPGKNLALTLVIKVTDSDDMILLNKAISLGVADAIGQLSGENVLIKWPNDIIARKKISGLLMETVKSGSERFLFAGIGINVNQKRWPEGIAADSLIAHVNDVIDITDVLHVVITAVSDHFQKLKDGVDLASEFNTRLWRRNEKVLLENEGATDFFGILLGVDHFGRLTYKDEYGIIHSEHHGKLRISKNNRDFR